MRGSICTSETAIYIMALIWLSAYGNEEATRSRYRLYYESFVIDIAIG